MSAGFALTATDPPPGGADAAGAHDQAPVPQQSFLSSLKQAFKQDFDHDVVRGHFDVGSPPDARRYYCLVDAASGKREPSGVSGELVPRKDSMTGIKASAVSLYGCDSAEQQGLLVTAGYVLTGAAARGATGATAGTPAGGPAARPMSAPAAGAAGTAAGAAPTAAAGSGMGSAETAPLTAQANPAEVEEAGSASAASAAAAARSADDAYLDGLQGNWVMTGMFGTQPVRYVAEGRRVLQGAFMKLHMIDAAARPQYEADVFIGFDAKAHDYIAHWLDRFGAAGARVVARGERRGQRLVLLFPYADGTFRDTFTWQPERQSWSLLIESQAGDGRWSTFASYDLTHAAPR